MLELNKLAERVEAMGRCLAQRQEDLQERLAHARELLGRHSLVTEALREKIARARAIDEWRRGALPLAAHLNERRIPPPLTSPVTLIAVDGSQIYPDRHGIATYYLLNIGSIVLRLGSGQAPTVSTIPELFFDDRDLFDPDGQLRPPEYINAQRSRREIAILADLAEAERSRTGGDPALPIIAMVDGPLLPWMRQDAEEGEALTEEVDFFVHQMRRLRRAHAVPVGYVDRPGSAYVLRILELLELSAEEISRETLRQGRFRQLTDRLLFNDLAPNERSALFTSNSDANDRYEQASGGDRIAFVYVNVARRPGPSNSIIVRLEVPGWVAAQPELLDIAQAAIYANCEPTGYPYVLTRAHELALVGQAERADLEAMLFQAMLRNHLIPTVSPKAQSKFLTARR
jgi:hypothetical protein